MLNLELGKGQLRTHILRITSSYFAHHHLKLMKVTDILWWPHCCLSLSGWTPQSAHILYLGRSVEVLSLGEKSSVKSVLT